MGGSKLLSLAFFGALLMPARAQVEGMRSFSNPRVLDSSVGLSSDVINDAVFDADGALWIGTAEGLDRFDGTHVQHFRHDATDSTSLPYNEVNRLAMGADGVLWVGTAQGLARYDPVTRSFRRYRYQSGNANSLPNDYVTSLLVDRQGRTWVGTYTNGFARYRSESDDFQRVVQPQAPTSYLQRQQHITAMFVQDPVNDERFWIPTPGGLLELDAERMEVHITTVPPAGDDDRLNDDRNTLRRLLVCPNGDLLITTMGAGVHRYVPRTATFTTYALKARGSTSQTLNILNDVVADADGTIYIGSGAAGLAVLDTLRGTLELLEPGDRPDMQGIAAIGIRGLSLGPDGTMFLYTERDLRLFAPERELFLTLGLPEGTGRSIDKKRLGPLVALDTDHVLVGGVGLEGLYLVDLRNGEKRSILPPAMPGPEPREHFTTQAMLREKDQVLVLAKDGLYRWDLRSDRMTSVATDLYDRVEMLHFLSMARHPSGDTYIGTRHDGLFRLGSDLQVREHFLPRPNDPNSISGSDLVSRIRVDPEGNVWMISDGGVSMFNPGTGRFRNLRDQPLPDAAERQIPVAMVIPDEVDGAWLLGHRSGLVLIMDRRADPWVLKMRSAPPSLISREVRDLMVGSDGTRWFSGAEGLVGRTDVERSYSDAQGLPKGFLGHLTELPDGRLIGTSGMQLAWQHTTLPAASHKVVHLALRDLRILGSRHAGESNVVNRERIVLPYSQRFFTLGISSMDVLGVQPHSVEYELHPFNGTWIPAGPEAQAAFTNVPAGDYRFRARAVSIDGSVLGELDVPLTILPPYWGTWWFRLAVSLLILGILFALFRYRMNTIRKEAKLTSEFNTRMSEMELTALRAQMNPHFLFNSLNSIRHHVLKSDTEAADRYLSKFARLIRLILDHSDQSLVPLSEELQALRLYLELEAARFDDKFAFRITVDPRIGVDTAMVPPMLIQPFLENAVWHGLMQKTEGGSIQLRIDQDGQNLKAVVEDDGIGRVRAGELKSRTGGRSRSRGMSITRQRLEMIAHRHGTDSEVHIEDLVLADGTPGGTRITLTIPLN